MPQAVQTSKSGATVRPLKELVPLIKNALQNAQEAADEAAKPYWQEAGELLLEAKGQMKQGEFLPWVKRNFGIGRSQAGRYMSLVDTTSNEQITRARPTTFSDAMRAAGQSPRGAERGGASWQAPVSEAISKINFEKMRQDEQSRADERKLERDLALKLIDIGFKVLATKLHPDKGGSRDAMARLNRVRDRLRTHA